MKKIFSVVLLTLVSVIAFAQKPVIKFDQESFDFGDIQEKDGKVSCVFKYQNTGKTHLVINNVQASCGCTTPLF